jgi:hypothetical protein
VIRKQAIELIKQTQVATEHESRFGACAEVKVASAETRQLGRFRCEDEITDQPRTGNKAASRRREKRAREKDPCRKINCPWLEWVGPWGLGKPTAIVGIEFCFAAYGKAVAS